MAFKIVDEEYHMEEQGRNPEVMGYVEGYTSDAVPVVRCRECVNCLIDNTERKYHLCMRHNSVFPRKVDLMDFCSYGERKEGAD